MADNFPSKDATNTSRTLAAKDIAAVLFPRNILSNPDGTDVTLPALVGGKSPVVSTPAAGTLADKSGTITTGGTAQQLMASNASRIGWAIQNNSSGDLWVNPLGTAAASQPSLKIASGVYYESPPGGQGLGAVSIFGATTGQAFSAREW